MAVALRLALVTDGPRTVNSIVNRSALRQVAPMRIALPLPLLCALAALAACAPVSTYYKPGARVETVRKEELSCKVNALRQAPVANQTRQNPPVYVPPRRVCNSGGTCTTYGGYWRPGQVYTVDVNQALRGQLETSCMAKKGYQPLSLPECRGTVAATLQNPQQPTITEQSCAIRNPDGTVVIAEQAG